MVAFNSCFELKLLGFVMELIMLSAEAELVKMFKWIFCADID